LQTQRRRRRRGKPNGQRKKCWADLGCDVIQGISLAPLRCHPPHSGGGCLTIRASRGEVLGDGSSVIGRYFPSRRASLPSRFSPKKAAGLNSHHLSVVDVAQDRFRARPLRVFRFPCRSARKNIFYGARPQITFTISPVRPLEGRLGEAVTDAGAGCRWTGRRILTEAPANGPGRTKFGVVRRPDAGVKSWKARACLHGPFTPRRRLCANKPGHRGEERD